MATIGNVPQDETVLQLQARKSFALGVWVQSFNGAALDITGCTMRMVVRKRVSSTTVNDSDNLITNSVASIIAPVLGFAKFNLQATDLNLPEGEYMFAISLIDQGYSSVLVQGVLEIVQNTEFSSLGTNYIPTTDMAASLRVMIGDNNSITVQAGPALAPGETIFTEDMANKLLQMWSGAVSQGQTLTADDIVEGVNHLFMTPAERTRLANLSLAWADITGKPAFGDIITFDQDDFLKPGQVAASDITSGVINKARIPKFIDLNGTSRGTAAPSGGSDGDTYLRYT